MRTNQIMKYTLFTSCYLFWVASGLMVAVGIYARLSKEAGAVDSLLADPSIILLAVGTLIFCITFVGCLGALWVPHPNAENVCLDLAHRFHSASGGCSFRLHLLWHVQVLWGSFIQDWSQNIYFDCQDTNPSLEHCAVPSSCCLQDKENLKGCQAENLVYTKGCLEKIVHWGPSNLLLMGGLAFGLLILEVVVFLLAVMLIYQTDFIIQKSRSTKRRRRRRRQSFPEK